MRIQAPISRPAGSALMIVIMFVGIVTLVLGSYLALTSNQNQSTVRSRDWNQALPVAEAGVEEGLTQIYNNAGNYAADGWVSAGANSFTKHRNLGNDYYDVTVSGTPSTGLSIISTGYVQSVTFVDQGRNYNTDTRYVSRIVQVTAKNASIPAAVGFVAKSVLDFTGNVGVDSYDSTSLASSSTNANAVGMYDATKRGAAAFVGCTGPNNLALGGNQHIYGSAASGVGTLIPTAKGSASIGDLSWVRGVLTGHATNNFKMDLPDVVAPFSSASAPMVCTNNIYGNPYDYVLDNGNYLATTVPRLASIYVSNSAVLYIPNDCSLGTIVFAPGAKLDLYIGGSTMPYPAVYSQVTNATPSLSQAVSPAQYRVLGLNNCTWMGMAGGNSVVGVIYAPHLDMYMSGGGTIYGAATVNSFFIAGGGYFHHDLSLNMKPSITSLVILSWAEQ